MVKAVLQESLLDTVYGDMTHQWHPGCILPCTHSPRKVYSWPVIHIILLPRIVFLRPAHRRQRHSLPLGLSPETWLACR